MVGGADCRSVPIGRHRLSPARAAPRSGPSRRRGDCRCAAVHRVRPRGRRFRAARGPPGRRPPMPSSRTSTVSVPPSTAAVTWARVACECLTTLVSASATMKYALASISGGSRVLRDVHVEGKRRVARRGCRRRPGDLHASGPPGGSRGPAREARRCPARRDRAPRREATGAAPCPSLSARCASFSVTIVWTRRCWAPSWRSRTTRRRASSPAVSTRARDAVS